jgi:hypothetical protein
MGCARAGTLLVVTAFLATACGERQNDSPTAPELAGQPSACDFNGTTGVKNLTKNEFGSNSPQATLANNMSNAGAGTALATSYGYQILDAIGNKYDSPQTSTSNASALTVALLKCMNIGGATVPAASVFNVALGATGAFGVRFSGDADAVISHDDAWLLVPPSPQTWGQVSGTSALLAYGVPATNNSFTNDTPLTGIFDWNTLPVVTAFADPGIIIGNCQATGYLQHNPVSQGAEILAYLGDCSTVTAQGTERAPRTFAERLFRAFSPTPAYATLITGGTLGSGKHLSPFQVENIVNVNLVPVNFTWRKSGNVVGTAFNPTPVYRILSGGNTLFHQPDVLVWLEATNNSGVNVDVCNNWAWTNADGVAQFPAAYLNKAGGYTMIARTDGTNTNSDIPSVPEGRSALSPLINVKNGNPGPTCDSFHKGDPLPDNPGPNGTP